MRVLRFSGLATLTSLVVFAQAAHGACSFSPTLGDDAYVCDSGTAASLTDLQGNNRLTLPASGTGTITGAVIFGAGADQITIASGTVGGAINQGDGIDDFVMSGGRIASLAQGDGRDTFRMTGGTIVGAFEDGDVAAMTGGTIGRVDMKLDNNIFELSGGAHHRQSGHRLRARHHQRHRRQHRRQYQCQRWQRRSHRERRHCGWQRVDEFRRRPLHLARRRYHRRHCSNGRWH